MSQSGMFSIFTPSYAWVPPILRPDYTWPCPIRSPVSTVTPPIPRISSPLVRRIWGFVHRRLFDFARFYCWMWRISPYEGVAHLPFGLVLKWSHRTSLSEAVATQMVRHAGIPAPKVLCYGDHPGRFEHFSILMTRLPGNDLYSPVAKFKPENEQPLMNELKECTDAMRQWKNPFSENIICSATGEAIRSVRVPYKIMGPFQSQRQLLDFLFKPSSSRTFESRQEFEETMTRAKKLYDKEYRVVFTHGDFQAHNILFTEDFRLAGILDWESAGWYPEFWDFTTPMRWGGGTWWNQAMAWMSQNQYELEVDADRALNNLTIDSYVGF